TRVPPPSGSPARTSWRSWRSWRSWTSRTVRPPLADGLRPLAAPAVVAGALASAALILTHNLTAAIFLPALVLYGLGRALAARSGRGALLTAAMLGLGLL